MKYYTNVQAIGDQIFAKEVINGKRVRRKLPYRPTLYVPSKKKTEFRTLTGSYVEPMQPGGLKETREFIRSYEDVQGFDIYGNTYFQYAWISDEYPEETVEYDMSNISLWSLDIECESEGGFPKADSAVERINAITFKNVTKNIFHVFGLDVYGNKYVPEEGKNIQYHAFDDEEEMLNAFIQLWKDEDPDIITGWNIQFFDIPYLVNRINRIFDDDGKTAKHLSPWGKIQASTLNFKGQDVPTYDISGVAILDYYRLYRKYVLDPRENYRLGYITELELGKTKVDHEEYDNFKDFYQKDFPKYIKYNIEDTLLVEELEAKLKLIELTLVVAYQAHVNYEDVISQVRTWDTLIYNCLRRKGVVIPLKVDMHKDQQFAGAYVKDPKPGLYRWVVSFDVTSLYPSIIKALNIGNETKVAFKWDTQFNGKVLARDEKFLYNWEAKGVPLALTRDTAFVSAYDKAKENNWTVAINGIHYSKDHVSFYSEMIEKLFNDRVEYRKQAKICKEKGDLDGEAKFDLKQKSTKIQMNSLYGAMGNQYFRFFDVENAEAVTLTGQFIIQFIERGINAFLNKSLKTKNVPYVLYCDTDSIYVTLDNMVQATLPNEKDQQKIVTFLNKVCEAHLEKELDRLFLEITSEYLNGMPGHLKMKREVIANQGIWTAKKRYILNCFDIEGERFGLGETADKKHAKPKLKCMGIEIKKATVPKFCRDKMEDAVKLLMDKGDNNLLIDFIDGVREEFVKLPADQISFPRGVNGLQKYFGVTNAVPLHVKGALCYNRLLNEFDLDRKYPAIQEGEKIKYIYLKVPNPTRDKVVAFIQKLPPEFKLEKYLDLDLQFEKSFIDPLNAILKAIGWTHERVATLDSWF